MRPFLLPERDDFDCQEFACSLEGTAAGACACVFSDMFVPKFGQFLTKYALFVSLVVGGGLEKFRSDTCNVCGDARLQFFDGLAALVPISNHLVTFKWHFG